MIKGGEINPKGICNIISASAHSSCWIARRGYIWVRFCGFYSTLHKFTLCRVFFIYRMFYVFTTILAYLKFMNEMRSPVNRPKKKNSSRFILIHIPDKNAKIKRFLSNFNYLYILLNSLLYRNCLLDVTTWNIWSFFCLLIIISI